jgi:hypothetical protein
LEVLPAAAAEWELVSEWAPSQMEKAQPLPWQAESESEVCLSELASALAQWVKAVS